MAKIWLSELSTQMRETRAMSAFSCLYGTFLLMPMEDVYVDVDLGIFYKIGSFLEQVISQLINDIG